MILKKFIIGSDVITFDRIKDFIAEGNIKINDTEKNLFIESDVITFDRIKDFITAEGNIKINDTEKIYFLSLN